MNSLVYLFCLLTILHNIKRYFYYTICITIKANTVVTVASNFEHHLKDNQDYIDNKNLRSLNKILYN